MVATVAAKDEDSTYRMYYDHREPLRLMPSHRVLAMNRGEKEGFLKVALDVDKEKAQQLVRYGCSRRAARRASTSRRRATTRTRA